MNYFLSKWSWFKTTIEGYSVCGVWLASLVEGSLCRTCSAAAWLSALASLCFSISFFPRCCGLLLFLALFLHASEKKHNWFVDRFTWKLTLIPKRSLYSHPLMCCMFSNLIWMNRHSYQPHPTTHNRLKLYANESVSLPLPPSLFNPFSLSSTTFVSMCLISDGVVYLREMPLTAEMKEKQEWSVEHPKAVISHPAKPPPASAVPSSALTGSLRILPWKPRVHTHINSVSPSIFLSSSESSRKDQRSGVGHPANRLIATHRLKVDWIICSQPGLQLESPPGLHCQPITVHREMHLINMQH